MSVSIVMPNFNNERFIRDTIESVIEDPAVSEIVIYDNGSTDRSPEIAFAAGRSKVRLIRGGANLGATLGRHEAIANAQNEFICFVDGDDCLSPGAVSNALATLQSQNLDIALFELINVDADGLNPRPFVLPSREAFDGRTAFAMTIGSWEMHIWGVIRKRLYLEAWAGFTPHGYSDDELLTRAILLQADRIAGCSGQIFYRVIPKKRTSAHLVGIARTAIRVLQLAQSARIEETVLDRQHGVVVRHLFGLLRRVVLGSIPRQDAAPLFDEYFAVSMASGDRRPRLEQRLLRFARPLLG